MKTLQPFETGRSRTMLRSEHPSKGGRVLAESTAWLLQRDGDERLDLDPIDGRNRYGCWPNPRPEVIDFGSCTAQTVSTESFLAAEQARLLVAEAMERDGDRQAVAGLSRRIAADLVTSLGLAGKAEAVLAASGTTAALLAGHLCRPDPHQPTLMILLGAEETGSGTPLALAGRHASSRTPAGIQVTQGEPVEGLGASSVTLCPLPIRDQEGRPLAPALMAEMITLRVAEGLNAGRKVVLHALESSKTGLISPGLDAVLAARRRFGPNLSVIVDACQMRTPLASLAAYLDHGCLLVVTGSKFFGGPAFSGAVLLPRGRAPQPLAAGLTSYSWQADWPVAWDGVTAHLNHAASLGLCLRWQAALAEMKAFAGMEPGLVEHAFATFRQAAAQAFGNFPQAVILPDRDQPGSIVSFALRRPGGEDWLSPAEMKSLHRALDRDAAPLLPPEADSSAQALARRICHIGQPVTLSQGPYPAVLRLAAGARTLRRYGSDIDALKDDIGTVLAKLSLLLSLLPKV